MEINELDLQLACMEKADITADPLNEGLKNLRKESEVKLENIRREVQKAVNLELERKGFFEQLFTICIPSDLLENEIIEDNIIVLRSQPEHLVLVVKKIDNEYIINIEDIKKSYEAQMKQSKQQTQLCLSESRMVNGIRVFYFSASHSMPEQKHFNYIILFNLKNKTIILDFNIREKEYSYWADIIYAIIGTIRQGGDHDE
ncbi:hypothetical protein [Lacrimispora sp.]|uniref:hypothetical protein n=1 Tax=Lacrimispora sp. TaxID=2719234 RepID=UPI003991259E